MRVGFRTLLSLALCAAAAAAALAHFAIDVIGDYALDHDSYDSLQHDSRVLISGVALGLAALLAARGLRSCCEIAARNRVRLPGSTAGMQGISAFVLMVAASSSVIVPLMEWLDGRLDGSPVRHLGEAFGGSLLLGLITTVVCASLVAALVYAFARWLISHRDTIATILETLLHWSGNEVRHFASDLGRYRLTFRRRAPYASRLSKRGPPVALFV